MSTVGLPSLERRLEFQRLLSQISTQFIDLPPQEIDEHITRALGAVGTFFNFNLVAISKFLGKGDLGEVTHIWTAESLPAVPPGFTNLDFPWLAERLVNGQPALLSSLDELPPAAKRDRQTYETLGIRSAYNWPLQVAKSTVGCLGLCSVGREQHLPPGYEEELQLLAQLMAGTLVRARADQALRESQARLDLAAAAAGAGLWSLNLENQVFWVTEKTRQLFDFPPDEPVTFQRFLATVLPEDQERIRSTVKLLIEPGREAEVEYRIKRPDGSLRWILSRGRVHSNKSGVPDCLMGVSVDQTPRKTAELASQQAKTTLDAIIESTQDLIWSVDSECFGLMTFNGGLSRYFQEGRRIAIKPGMRPEDLFPPGEYVKRWRDMYRRALDHGPFVTEYVVFTGKRTLLLSFNLLRRDGKTFGVSVFGKDVTEQKTAQKEAHELRETLAHTGRVTVLGQLTSTLAHELSQPLGAILRNAESAKLILQMASPDLEELRAIVTDIRVDDERAGSVINRLRSLLKRRSLDLQPVALPELVSEVLTLVQTDANLRHVKLHCSVQPGLPKVSGDRIHLQQVMLNLIINAMDALSEVEDRCVHVTVQATAEGMIQVLVADNGPGIAEGSAERVFEPFFTTKSSGMGLGLAVSKTLIEAHHGTIWCTNPPQGGACFGFALPLITKERAL